MNERIKLTNPETIQGVGKNTETTGKCVPVSKKEG